ncbi:MAG TPA: SHOCT domain-containing protein [Gemmatimonadales bacterium]|nr:SHOCT domain-containing protein [Gemmatimonadales bacterium]
MGRGGVLAVAGGAGALAVALPGAPVGAQERAWEWGMHPMAWMWGAGGLVVMLTMLLFWGLVIAALVLAVRWLLTADRRPGRDTALEILRERYARGEINREEFEARRRDLS